MKLGCFFVLLLEGCADLSREDGDFLVAVERRTSCT